MNIKIDNDCALVSLDQKLSRLHERARVPDVLLAVGLGFFIFLIVSSATSDGSPTLKISAYLGASIGYLCLFGIAAGLYCTRTTIGIGLFRSTNSLELYRCNLLGSRHSNNTLPWSRVLYFALEDGRFYLYKTDGKRVFLGKMEDVEASKIEKVIGSFMTR